MSQTAPTVDPRRRRVNRPGLKGRNLLVTDGSSGIGQAIAVRFAAHGANVAINYLTTPDEAAGTAEQVHACMRKVQQHGFRDVLVQGDVSWEDDAVRMVGEPAERLGGLDILVDNAGIQLSRPSEELGSAVALEYGGRGIRVNGVGPGAIITPINRAWVDDPVTAEMVTSHIPLGRAGRADEMAGVCAFLAPDDAAYITGQTIFVDGGLTLYTDFREPWSSE